MGLLSHSSTLQWPVSSHLIWLELQLGRRWILIFLNSKSKRRNYRRFNEFINEIFLKTNSVHVDIRKLTTLAGVPPVKRNMKGNTIFVAVGGLIVAGGLLLGLYWSYSSASNSNLITLWHHKWPLEAESPCRDEPVIVSQDKPQSNFSPKSTRNGEVPKIPKSSSKIKTEEVDTVVDTVVDKFVEPEARESVTLNTVAKSTVASKLTESVVDLSSEMVIEESKVALMQILLQSYLKSPLSLLKLIVQLKNPRMKWKMRDTNVVFGSNGVEFSLENIQSEILRANCYSGDLSCFEYSWIFSYIWRNQICFKWRSFKWSR